MPVRKHTTTGLKLCLIMILLLAGLSASQAAAASTSTLVFGPAYAQASGLSASTNAAFTGDGAWYELYPSSKTNIYFDPLASFGASFTIAEIESITYHTRNNADNPSHVDFYLALYTAIDANCPVPDSWYCRHLIAEPLYARGFVPPTAGVWNSFTTDAGSNQLTFNDSVRSGNFGFYNQPTLQEIQAGDITWSDLIAGGNSTPIDYGPQVVRFISFQTGSGWSAFEGYLDAITIALNTGHTYIIDLEAAPDPVYVDYTWAGSPIGAEVAPGKFFGWNAFDTIQGGVTYVAPGGTVNVAAGTYAENVVIDKSVTLIGDPGDANPGPGVNAPVLDGQGNPGDAFRIANGVSDVVIQGFVMQDYASNASGIGNGVSAWVASTSNITIQDNLFTNLGWNGVLVGNDGAIGDHTNWKIKGNILEKWAFYGFELTNTSDSSIENNIITADIDFTPYSAITIIARRDQSKIIIQDNQLDGEMNSGYGAILLLAWDQEVSNPKLDDVLIKGNVLAVDNTGLRQILVWDAGGTITNVEVTDNELIGLHNFSGSKVDASPNYWGSACGPISGAIVGNVEYSPWYTDATMTTTGAGELGSFDFPTGSTAASMNALIACAAPGSTFTFSDPGYAYPGGLTVGAGQSELTFLLNGATVGAGSPGFTIAGDDITIEGPGILDGGGAVDPGILVLAGADNFILNGLEVTGWRDGVELAGSVTSFKIVRNWFHTNSESGLQINPGVVLNGIVTIESNLFKENGSTGIQNDSGTALIATYNSWGHIDGPASGDTVSSAVVFEPWTYFEIYMDVEPDTGAIVRTVVENESVAVALKIDAHKLYGMSFKLNWNSSYLTLNSVVFEPFWDARCTDLNALPVPGELAYRCNLLLNDVEVDTAFETVLTLNVTAAGAGLTGSGPWTALFDLAHLEADTSAGAVGGVKIWVDNAGYGAPSKPERDIRDADDGKLIITGIANYSGFVDLQGRANDSGALVQVLSSSTKAGSIVLADATSASSGAYFTAHIHPNVLLIGNNYHLFVNRALFLPTTVMAIDANVIPNPPISEVWYHSKLLTIRPYTPLNTVLLLGGDATNDNVIDILDLACIGNNFGGSPSACGIGGSSDVNGDGVIDINDLTLAGGNYTLNYSPWNP